MSTFSLRQPPVARAQLQLIAVLLVLAVVGWLVTGDRMAGMDEGPGTDPGALGFFITAWVVMMAAMMFPSVAPMVLTYDRIRVHRRQLGKSAPAAGTVLFVGGYLVSWAGFGLLGYGVYRAGAALTGDTFAWDNGGRWLAGGVILLAAAWELTPAKDVCLRKCRTPFHFLLGGWRDGGLGALRLGVEHGAWCIGCCWGLMAALFAVGVMSIGWMAFIAALIAIEKLIPWPRRVPGAIAALLAALGLAVALVPERVPGLTVPGSGGMTMGGDRGGMQMDSHSSAMPGGGRSAGGMQMNRQAPMGRQGEDAHGGEHAAGR